MTITPTELTEIERKARAYQAEEAANPEAKTCQRPTPELVLRLVEDTRENKRHWDAAISLCLKKAEEKAEVERERDDLAKQLKEANTHLNVATGYCQIKSKKIESLEHERDELRAKADQLREQNAGMGVELLGKDDTIKELRAKVAELEKAHDQWSECISNAVRDAHRLKELQAIVDRYEAHNPDLCPCDSRKPCDKCVYALAAQSLPKPAPLSTGNESKEWVWVDGAQATKGGTQ